MKGGGAVSPHAVKEKQTTKSETIINIIFFFIIISPKISYL